MPRSGPRALVVSASVLAALATAAARDLAAGGDADRARAFHAATGAIGAGPALGPQSCAAAFDPRVEDVCADHLEPVPGGDALCPDLGGPRSSAR